MADKSDENVKKRLRVLFLSVLLPLLIVTVISGAVLLFLSNRQITRYVNSESRNALLELDDRISEYLAPALINMQDFVTLARDTQDEEVLNALVHAFAENIDYTLSFYYSTAESRFSRDGFYVDSSDWVPDDDWIPQQRPWFVSAKDTNEMCYEPPYVDDMTGGVCVSLSQRVDDRNGEFQGVVALDLLMKDMADMVNSVSVSPNGKIYMLLSDGTYLTNEDDAKVTAANYFSDSAISYSAGEYLDGEKKSFIENGRYYAVTRISVTPWFIVAEGPTTDFSGNAMRNILLLVFALCVFSLLCSLVNVRLMKGMRSGERSLGKRIYAETQSLVLSAKDTAATASEQNESVKEIVATMEDCTALSEDISTKVGDVSSLTVKTNSDIASGVDLIADNKQQLYQIAEANKTTIDGIKELGGKISTIWDIVTLINTVADQAKIIAFNAELEASSAGEAGKNFHIVASEIRRLADGIISGTKEIKDKIAEIEKSSDTLILMSENGTEKIAQGVDRAKMLEERFASMKSASEITAESAEKMSAIIQQQTSATEQILLTLKKIAARVEHFSEEAAHIFTASENLNTIAEGLS